MNSVFFNQEAHSYTMDGLPLVGVTQFIQAVVAKGNPDNGAYADVPEFILKKACERGTRIHNDIEIMMCGFDIDTPEANKAKDMLCEYNNARTEVIISDYKFFASAIDILAEHNGMPAIIDIKTNSELTDDKMEQYAWQLSIYRFFTQESELKILWIPRNVNKSQLIDVDYKGDAAVRKFLYSDESWKYYQEFLKEKNKMT